MNSVNQESEVDEFDLDVQFTNEIGESDSSLPDEPHATAGDPQNPPPGCDSYTCYTYATCYATCGGVTGHPCAC